MNEIINDFSDLIQIGTVINNNPQPEVLPNNLPNNNQIPIANEIFINNQSNAVIGVPIQPVESASINSEIESTFLFSQNLLNQERRDFERLRRLSRRIHSRRSH